MPSRYTVLAILAFWVATTGWLFYRDVRPRLVPGEGPPFVIDLADEASNRPIRWTLLKEDHKNPRFRGQYLNQGYAETSVGYREADDTFDIQCVFKLWTGKEVRGNADLTVGSHYRVNRDGELREIRARVEVTVGGMPIEGRLEGPVRGGMFTPHVAVTLKFAHDGIKRDLEPVPVAPRGSVLNPMQPLNRLPGLRPGQHWRMPLVDPLSDALTAASGLLPGVPKKQVEARFVDAEVLPETRRPPLLTFSQAGVQPRRQNYDCHVIDYSGEDFTARTWVRADDGVVLRQEVAQHEDVYILDRDP